MEVKKQAIRLTSDLYPGGCASAMPVEWNDQKFEDVPDALPMNVFANVQLISGRKDQLGIAHEIQGKWQVVRLKPEGEELEDLLSAMRFDQEHDRLRREVLNQGARE